MEIISYIRGLLFENRFTNRKRRAVDDFENSINAKFRRVSTSQMSASEDDWVSTASSTSFRRRSGLLDRKDIKQRPSWLKENNIPISVEDDDDDVQEIKKPTDSFEFLRRSTGHHVTSTPNYRTSRSTQNGDDDVAFVRYTEAPEEKNRSAKKLGFDYIKPATSCFSKHNGSTSSTRLQNGTRKRDMASPLLNNIKSKPTFPPVKKFFGTHSTALDQSFRLDEKRKYKELLTKTGLSNKNFLSAFAEYTTPVSKFFGYNNNVTMRGKKMVEMCKINNKKPPQIIDLTDITKNKNGTSRLSTRDTIKKVLNEFDTDVVIVKDSDSEVEILPTPPSPKADFHVEKCNSLKTYVDTSEPVHDDWITKLKKQHDEASKKCQRQIDVQRTHVKTHSDINDEIRSKLLDENVRKCLYIREVLLPDEERVESAFPTLTPEQEALVDNALDKSLSGNEILAKKFNISITRQDILTLAGLNWLNDEVINYYMNLIIERGKDDRWPKTYAFNTFFYPKICSGGQSSVRRWTKKVDIFTYDIIAVPIHLRMHWCMAMIDFRTRKISYYDSMGSSNKTCLETLLRYLGEEHVDKKKTEFDTTDWRLACPKNIPQQMNGSDCGMFSCTFAEVLSRNAEINFSQEDMPYLRRKMVLEILESRLLVS